MAELGDTRIDLLKIDVEGGEYQLLPTLDLNALGVKVFAIPLRRTAPSRTPASSSRGSVRRATSRSPAAPP